MNNFEGDTLLTFESQIEAIKTKLDMGDFIVEASK